MSIIGTLIIWDSYLIEEFNGEMNNAWSGEDVRGFSKIASNQVMIHQKIQELAEKK